MRQDLAIPFFRPVRGGWITHDADGYDFQPYTGFDATGRVWPVEDITAPDFVRKWDNSYDQRRYNDEVYQASSNILRKLVGLMNRYGPRAIERLAQHRWNPQS